MAFFGITIGIFLLLLFTNDLGRNEYSFLSRTWGFDHIEYYPQILAVLLLVLFATVIIAFTFQKMYDAIHRMVSDLTSRSLLDVLASYKVLLFLILSVFTALAFYFFRIKYIFLGDFEIRMDATAAGEFHRDSYLTMFLLNKIYTLLNTKFGISAHSIFVMASVVSGGFFTFFTLMSVDLLGSRRWQKIVLALFVLLNGSLFIFTGYIEIYPLPALMVSATIYVSLLYMKDRAWFVVVVLTVIVSAGMHLMSVAALPGILFIWAWKNQDKLRFLKLKRIHLILLVVVSLPVLYTIARRMQLIDVVPLKGSSYYDLFTWTHFWEFLNSQLLAGGLSFLLFVFVAYAFLRKRMQEDLVVHFLLIQSVYYLFIVFVLNKMRGSTDCDITSFPSFYYSMLVAYVLASQFIRNISKKDVFYILSITLLFNALNTVLWIGINTSDRSIEKVADMIEGDPAHYYVNRMPADLLLAMMYANNELVENAIEYYDRSYRANYDDPRSHYNYATYLINNEQLGRGMQVLDNLTKVHPYYPLSYPILVEYYQNENRYQDVFRIATNMYTGYKTNPQYFERLDKNFLISVFTYLRQIAIDSNNADLSRELTAILAGLQN